ncbi:MAG: response regulator [Ignavibacteria bacterium]
MINILLADDHTLFREGIKKLLADQADIKITAEAKNTIEVLDICKKKQFDVVLLDISMPGKSGLDIIKDVKRMNKKAVVLILTMYEEDRFAFRAFKNGASGYLTKENTVQELVKAIRKVVSGGKYISSDFAEELANEIKKENGTGRPRYHKLSDREFQVMIMITSGKKVVEIAKDLDLSKSTINTYRARILEKLGLRGNVDLTHYAIDNKLI